VLRPGFEPGSPAFFANARKAGILDHYRGKLSILPEHGFERK